MAIETKVGKISLVKKCIIIVEGKPDIHIELEDMYENDKAFKKLLKGKKDAPFLVLFGDNASISKEALHYFSNRKRSKIKRAEALVVPQLNHKINARFHVTVQKPFHPTKQFTDEEEAMKWLMHFCDLQDKNIIGI